MKQIVIQADDGETKVGVVEGTQLVEVYIERASERRLVGNIYKGIVENVLPGMQAAFVNIGLDKNAFLYVEDVKGGKKPREANNSGYRQENQESIRNVVKEGQELLVQLTKEPIGTKGARVTTHITLPGRYLVLMPTMDYIGISRRVENERERERLRRIAEAAKPAGMGMIIRTVADGADEDQLSQEAKGLHRLWRKILSRSQNISPPGLVHRDLELVQRVLRDLYAEDVGRLTVNSRWLYDKAIDVIECFENAAVLKQRVLQEAGDLFELQGFDLEIEKALRRKVWLKSGGYLVVDQTEALTSIDVNTGKYVGSTHLADTVVRTNIEAAGEIARQIRLRNIGGIIIIDFIDMEDLQDKTRVLSILEEELKKDKTRVKILGITQLGLVEMTRKKVQQSLDSLLQRPCPYCEGRGRVLSEESVAIRTQKRLLQLAAKTDAGALLIEAHPGVAAWLIGSGGAHLRMVEERCGKQLIVRGQEGFHMEHTEIRALHDLQEIEALAAPVKVGHLLQVKIEDLHVGNEHDGIARLNGYVLDVQGGGSSVGELVNIEVIKVFRTYARARLLGRVPEEQGGSF